MPKIIQQQPAASDREKRRTRRGPKHDIQRWEISFLTLLQAISHFYTHTYWLAIFINTSLLSDSVFSHPDMILFVCFGAHKSKVVHRTLFSSGRACNRCLLIFDVDERPIAALLTCKTTFRCWESTLVVSVRCDLDHRMQKLSPRHKLISAVRVFVLLWS